MGQVDLDFKPAVPVFDAHIYLGRRHDKTLRVDTAEGAIKEMDRMGIERALAHSPHAGHFDPQQGNGMLIELIGEQKRLVPQFAFNPCFDNLDDFVRNLAKNRVRATRMFPATQRYPFKDWVFRDWMKRLGKERIPIWLGVTEISPAEFFDVAKENPTTRFVLSEAHYIDTNWVLPALRELPNVYIELSRFVVYAGVSRLVKAAGYRRVLFGSRFPESPMGAQLYNVHHCGLGKEALKAVCAGNLDRLLGGE